MLIPLYILGLLLRFGPQHGYQIKKRLTEELADFTAIKLPTIYYHLERLAQDGLVQSNTNQHSNRPEKTVYTITNKGELAFQHLLKEALDRDYQPTFPFDAGLYFSPYPASGSLSVALRVYIEKLEEHLRTLAKHRMERLPTIPEESQQVAKLLFSHHEHHYQAELMWAQAALIALSDT